MSLYAPATVTGNTMESISVGVASAGATVHGNTLTSSLPVTLIDLDVDVSGFIDNTFSAADPMIGIEGTLDGNKVLDFFGGEIGRYYATERLTVSSGAALTLASGVELTVRDLRIYGRMVVPDATLRYYSSSGYDYVAVDSGESWS